MCPNDTNIQRIEKNVITWYFNEHYEILSKEYYLTKFYAHIFPTDKINLKNTFTRFPFFLLLFIRLLYQNLNKIKQKSSIRYVMHKEIQMCKILHTKAVNIVERNCSSKKRDVGTIIYCTLQQTKNILHEEITGFFNFQSIYNADFLNFLYLHILFHIMWTVN